MNDWAKGSRGVQMVKACLIKPPDLQRLNVDYLFMRPSAYYFYKSSGIFAANASSFYRFLVFTTSSLHNFFLYNLFSSQSLFFTTSVLHNLF